jgi:NAD(P)H-dependent flavin oxidoreductase YrpB (nitropropane dioxygenase family)
METGYKRPVPATRLCAELGIEHPIFSVGFGAAAPPELAAAVSNAGGLGVVGSVPAAVLRERIARTRALTDRPFGVNLIISALFDQELVRARFDAIVEERPPLLVLFAGDPALYVDEAHAAGIRVFIQLGSPAEARAAVDAGVDGVIAQGYEAGGHVVAEHALFVNLPTIVDAVAPVPVLASGGIADGRGLAAALALGAQGVSLGTRFVASEEAFVPEDYKRRVVVGTAADTFYSRFLFDVGWPEVPHRALKTPGYDEWLAAGSPPSGERPGEGTTIGVNAAAAGPVDVPRWSSFMITPDFEGDVDLGPMWAGESVALIDEVLPAGEIVRRIAREADETIARLARPVENL